MTDWDDRPAGESTAGSEATGEIDDPEVDQLVGEIEVTREEMTVTVEEIGDRLDPRNIVADAKETVREATVGKVEQMANTAEEVVSNAGETVQQAGGSMVETIRRNPVPAAMVGIGLGWLAMSARSTSSGSGKSGRGAYGASGYRPPSYAREGYPANVEDATGGGLSGVGRRAGAMADQVGQTVERKADAIGEMAGQVPYQVQGVARQVGDEAGRMYHASPLAMGAIAVAVGTVIGLALPVTNVERRTIGQPARELLGRAEDAATDALDQAEQQARDAEQQARAEDQAARPH